MSEIHLSAKIETSHLAGELVEAPAFLLDVLKEVAPQITGTWMLDDFADGLSDLGADEKAHLADFCRVILRNLTHQGASE